MFTHVPVVRTGSGALITCVGTLKIPCASKSCPMCPFRTQRALSREGNLYSKILCREWLFTSHCNKNLISSVSLQPSVTACLVWQLKYNENLISFFFLIFHLKERNLTILSWLSDLQVRGQGIKISWALIFTTCDLLERQEYLGVESWEWDWTSPGFWTD